MTSEQTRLLEIARASAIKAEELAKQCDRAKLGLLARKWSQIAKDLADLADLEQKALKQEKLWGEPGP